VGAVAAGGHIHPHQLRHTFAHAFLDAGGSEGGLVRLDLGAAGDARHGDSGGPLA